MGACSATLLPLGQRRGLVTGLAVLGAELTVGEHADQEFG
jgi:hypothetical protein